MRYTPCWKQIGIVRERYLELLYFCRQYPYWLTNKTEDKRIDKKIAIIEECASAIDNGTWYASLIENICYAKAYSHMDKTLMPTADSNTFYRKRRQFFELMEQQKE